MEKRILYITEQINFIPKNAFYLTEKHLLNIENIKKYNVYYWQGTMEIGRAHV